MQSVYTYRFSRRTIYVSIIYLAIFALLGWALYHLYEGGYLSAWFTSFIVALVALMALSIPRKIVVSVDRVEIRCLLDITEIRRDEIASVRRVEKRRMKWMIPIFGGYGFFGYYGHFLDLRRLDRVRIYASEWRNFVEITDIYEDRLYVSCTDADRLVAELMPPGGNRPDDEEDDEEDDEVDEADETEMAEMEAENLTGTVAARAEMEAENLTGTVAAESGAAKPGVAEPATGKQGTAELSTAESDAAEPVTGKSNARKQGAEKSGTAESDTTEKI